MHVKNCCHRQFMYQTIFSTRFYVSLTFSLSLSLSCSLSLYACLLVSLSHSHLPLLSPSLIFDLILISISVPSCCTRFPLPLHPSLFLSISYICIDINCLITFDFLKAIITSLVIQNGKHLDETFE